MQMAKAYFMIVNVMIVWARDMNLKNASTVKETSLKLYNFQKRWLFRQKEFLQTTNMWSKAKEEQ